MEVLFGLAGVVVGWLLALATELWKQRKDGRAAADLIAVELILDPPTWLGACSGVVMKRVL
jgi:hypothetical protein